MTSQITKTPVFKDLQHALQKQDTFLHLDGVIGSVLPFYLKEIAIRDAPILLICKDETSAATCFSDFKALVGSDSLAYFPASYAKARRVLDTDVQNVLLRTHTVERLTRQQVAVVVTFPQAVVEKMVDEASMIEKSLAVKRGDSLDLDFLNELLNEYGFQYVDFVSQPGEFAVRGSIIDVFSFTAQDPVRIEFGIDKVEALRFFDIETQMMIAPCDAVKIVPNLSGNKESKRTSLFSFLPKKSVVVLQDIPAFKKDVARHLHEVATAYRFHEQWSTPPPVSDFYLGTTAFWEQWKNYRRICLAMDAETTVKATLNLKIQEQPLFDKKIQLLTLQMEQNTHKGIVNYICCDDEAQMTRIENVLGAIKEDLVIDYQLLPLSLSVGFLDLGAKFACYTDHQLFDRYHAAQKPIRQKKQHQRMLLSEFNELTPGDYITHIDHGVGKFAGVQKIAVGDKYQEAIKLIYAEGDALFVSIHALHKISKFRSKDAISPKLHKLGSAHWKKLKSKTKKKVKEIAFDLIALYAKRKSQQGFAYPMDTHLQDQLESSFMYEETPDQAKAIASVKKDMEAPIPMDRLVCGDVGFGKTEVAIRAAFKVVDNCKQVAVLVPTTLLAFQHYQSFKKRFQDFPAKVDYLSRFRTAKERRLILEKLKSGDIDVIIGTHQLTGKQVVFEDLGLLIIDEEQKFGVAVKDKLKTLKTNIDTLTLTATPIPRTLQFSLMAARDLSIITTPPRNRHPIQTVLIEMDLSIIKEAILKEVARGGQVFFIHNRIKSLEGIANRLREQMPKIRFRTGHGQMHGKDLEALMIDFVKGEFEVLIATSIIESGLDVANANTMFIDNAQSFGLSDLHQMRGRVGRSNKEAYCYLITPPQEELPSVAKKRLQALVLFSELGSGIQIAMKDLEIRGAGDLLGGNQSGFINEMGFDTYQEILAEAVAELKQEDFKSLYAHEDKPKQYVKEVGVDGDFELLIPDAYIGNTQERFKIYKKLASCKGESDLEKVVVQLKDRFGKLPDALLRLLDSLRIKWVAKDLGVERVVLKQKRMVLYFVNDEQSPYYQSNQFGKVLQYLQAHPRDCVLKEKETPKGKRLLMTFIKIYTVAQGLKTLLAVNDVVTGTPN